MKPRSRISLCSGGFPAGLASGPGYDPRRSTVLSRLRWASRRAGILGLAALVAMLPVPHAAQTAVVAPEVPLTLQEVLETSLRQNLDLVIAHANPQIAAENVEFQRAPFDPLIEARAAYDQSKVDRTIDATGQASQDTDFTVDNLSGSASLTHLLDFGGSYRFQITANQNDVSPQLRFDPQSGIATQFESNSDFADVNLQFTLPLLRGLGKEVNAEAILIAQGNLDISRNDLSLLAMNTIKQIEDAYWNLLAARAALDVERQSLDLANDLLILNRKKVEVGTLAPIEITQASAGVASREEGVIVAETAVENLEDELLRLMGVPADDPRWNQTVLPVDRPTYHDPQVNLDAALATAFERRPDLIAARLDLENREISERATRNLTKHRLDLELNLNSNKSSQDSVSQIVAPVPSGVGVVTQSQDGGPDWTVGLVYGYTLHNRAAESNYAIAKLNRDTAEVRLENTTALVRVDVRTAVRNAVSGANRVKAAEAAVALETEKLEAEQKKFENGMSTSFEVLTFQTDLANARLAEIRARLDYVKALSDLERAQGTLLEARGLRLDDTITN